MSMFSDGWAIIECIAYQKDTSRRALSAFQQRKSVLPSLGRYGGKAMENTMLQYLATVPIPKVSCH